MVHNPAVQHHLIGKSSSLGPILCIAALLIGFDGCPRTLAQTPVLKRETITMNREITLTDRYLNFPVKNGAPLRHLKLIVGGKVVREFEIELADNAPPDFWTFLDISDWKGQPATLEADDMAATSTALAAIRQGDEIEGAAALYHEKYRPQFHFTSRRGWLNDPNGLVYDQGEYHLYYQHNPYGTGARDMHWGHAVSSDLVHWKELPIALYPPTFGDWAWSGSAVVDHANAAGFQTGKDAPIVVAYTSTGRGECIAYSNDRGRTFTQYTGNPVIKHKGRDPDIFWYAKGKHWVMALYDEKNGDARDVEFYTSPDLKSWHYESRVSGYYECPNFFELPVDGDTKNQKWVLFAADGAYALGSFDGKTFTPETPKLPANWGNCYYAAQTYNDIPARDGRRIRIAWGRVDFPGMPFNQMMDFPDVLTLRTTPDGIRMFANPVKEIDTLHAKAHKIANQTLQPGDNPLANITGDLFDIRADLEPRSASSITLTVRGIPITYDVQKAELSCQGCTAPLKLTDGRLHLQILVDRASLEIFGGDGIVYMPIGVIPKDDDHSLSLNVAGGSLAVHSLDVYELRSIWADMVRD